MSNQMSQAEIDALISSMSAGTSAQPSHQTPAAPSAAPTAAASESPSAGSFAPKTLSQADIDALLAGGAAAEAPAAADPLDLGPILQAEVDLVLEKARVQKEQETEAVRSRYMPATGAAAAPGLSPGPASASGLSPRPAPQQAAAAPDVQALTARALLMDISLAVTVELGRIRMPLRQVLTIGPGTIITLENHLAQEPVAVLVEGRPVMRAEVVVIGENYGVRITETRLRQSIAS